MDIFFTVFFAVFISEMGDKTQLFIIAMATEYKIRHIIIGTVIAVTLLSLCAVTLGTVVSEIVSPAVVKLAAAFLFFVFAFFSFFPREDGEESSASSTLKRFGAVFSVALLFFLAEFGDKSQLIAIGFSSSYGRSNAAAVFLGFFAGILLADAIAFILSYYLGKHIPEKLMKICAGAVLAVFAVLTLREGLALAEAGNGIAITAGSAAVFALICAAAAIIRAKRKNRT